MKMQRNRHSGRELVYNGTFDQGAMDRLTYWHFDVANGRQGLLIPSHVISVMKDMDKKNDGSLNAKGLQLEAGHAYQLRFTAGAKKAKSLQVNITGAQEQLKQTTVR